jgi:hypothetical protein
VAVANGFFLAPTLQPLTTVLAEPNKCLAKSNKSRPPSKATKDDTLAAKLNAGEGRRVEVLM